MINSLEKLEIVKVCGGAAQILGGWSLPPAAAKCVRTILRIEHKLNFSRVYLGNFYYKNIILPIKKGGFNDPPTGLRLGIPSVEAAGFLVSV